mgnify:FL=1
MHNDLNNAEKWQVSQHPLGFIIEVLDEGEFEPITLADIDACRGKFVGALTADYRRNCYQEIISSDYSKVIREEGDCV